MDTHLFDNLEDALSRARRVLKKRWIRSLRFILIPTTAYIASIATISIVYFGRTGRLHFDTGNLTDWAVGFVVSLLALAGIWQISRELKIEKGIIVSRDELADIMMLARHDASVTVVSIAGDLSWLEKDKILLLELARKKPEIDFKFYYDKPRTPPRLRTTIDELSKSGITFIPYPFGFRPNFKCTLIDGASDQEKRVCSTWREGPKLTGQQREGQHFHWKEYTSEHKLIPKAINSFTELIDSWPSRPLLVGISGINNVGKTAFANALINRLGDRLPTHLFEDPFREHVGYATSLHDNFRILIFQLMLFSTRQPAQVYLFDTTVAESLCYLSVRGGAEGEFTYQHLGHVCAEFIRTFDLVVDVSKDLDDIGATTYVTKADRVLIGNKLHEFYSRHGIVRQRVILKSGEWDISLAQETERIADRVHELLEPRNRR